jgi:Flp pilus assembly protein TadG
VSARKQIGAAIVEFALVMPFLLLLTFIVTEYSRALHQYDVLTKAVRDGARYLSMQHPNTKITEAKNLMVYGNLTGTGSPLVFGLTTAHVPDPVWTSSGSAPVIVTVTVQIGTGAAGAATRYKFVPIFASVFGTTFGSAEFAPITATMRSGAS